VVIVGVEECVLERKRDREKESVLFFLGIKHPPSQFHTMPVQGVAQWQNAWLYKSIALYPVETSVVVGLVVAILVAFEPKYNKQDNKDSKYNPDRRLSEAVLSGLFAFVMMYIFTQLVIWGTNGSRP
jgi:heme/copper-type cytochrome/quinol oxidase subunit 2